ncbi:MAG: leucine-rich repeat domain-containing protein [Faecalibacterium sp.]|nr:leucine-rich repeat domain-containing protein [Ruminococcus sp.]MCM1392505.1 leucine-rich repeat domain-containing protein [Ruminococcus sp.]MCM1486090.1 leucine-rich repeat domain-containing protein [Faecalibacterium sp.]
MKKSVKKFFAAMLTVIMVLSVFSVAAFALDTNLKYELNEFDQAVLVSCNSNAKGTVTVDSQVLIKGKWYPVKSIGDEAFEDCDKITEIVIPEGVTTIGYKAFADCDSLKTVDIPSSLVNCDYDAFDDCGSITINCYTSNYQFFSVIGFGSNIIINILDKTEDEAPDDDTANGKTSVSFLDRIRDFFIRLFAFFGIKIG